MSNPIYARFIVMTALRAIDGDKETLKLFEWKEFRRGIEAHLEELELEISGLKQEEPDRDLLMHLIVKATDEGKIGAMRALRQWLRGAKQIDIVDPYLLNKTAGSNSADIDKFSQEFAHILPSGCTVNIFINGHSKDVRSSVWRKIKEGRTARLIQTDAFHDRFIAKDDGIKLMGASFNGLGRKISALITLDDEDAAEIRAALGREKMRGTRLAGPPF